MPLPTDRVICYSRLCTPPEHLDVLIEPPAARIRAELRSQPDAAFADVPILDTTLAALRAQLRRRLELVGPVIMCGHQAEFFHAGVFAKNVATHAMASECGGDAVFLSVDSDLPKSTQLALPQTTSGGLRRIDVAIPGCEPTQPFESQPPVPRAHWLQFFARVGALYEFHDRSLLGTFARAWLATEGPEPHYCDALAQARAATEAALGLPGIRELRISGLCNMPEFRAFLAHLLLDARRCAEFYDAACVAYRRRHRVRAAGRPVPPLAVGENSVELPFWVMRSGQPRWRLFVARHDDVVEILADAVLIGTMSCADLRRAATHDGPWPIERDGWCVRPRALALSAFARLFLTDLFIHGIGGAKYDEMMEEFALALFGAGPAPACCVSATVRLPLPHKGVRLADIAAARQQSRDLRYNPQRHLRQVPESLVTQRGQLVRKSRELATRDPRDHAGRRVVFREIRRVNERMLETDPWRSAEYDQRIATLLENWKSDRIALDREYFYALHLEHTLEQLVQKIRTELAIT